MATKDIIIGMNSTVRITPDTRLLDEAYSTNTAQIRPVTGRMTTDITTQIKVTRREVRKSALPKSLT